MKKSHKIIAVCLSSVILVGVAIFAFVRLVLAAPTQPVQAVELTSQNSSFTNGDPGAWKITKWAGWSSKNTARVIFDIDTVLKKKHEHDDVIFVLDATSAVSGRLGELKNALTSFADTFLEDSESSIGLVEFDHEYIILSDFTNDKEAIAASFNDEYGSNGGDKRDYYQGLNGAEMLLRNYTPSDDHSVSIVFVIAGEPNEETAFQKAQYRFIKSKYPFVNINVIQYGMGSNISDNIAGSSDNQFIADSNNIEDAVYSAAVSAYYYDSFVISDYINTEYFEINPNSAPYTTNGEIEVDGNRVTLTITDNLRAGSKAQFEIDLKLKDSVESPNDLYPTNDHVEVSSILFDTPNESITSDSTPVLKRKYSVTYNPNQPSDCEVSGVPTEPESHLVYNVAAISTTVPTCAGYNFAGYDIVTSGVRKMNDDYFWMPEKDVEIAATWTKVDIKKSMDGDTFDIMYLYDEIASRSVGDGGGLNLDDYVDFSAAPSETNGKGVMTVASTALDEYPIHYYRGVKDENNVKFGNTCWLIVRTTELGGIKLLYNGEAINGTCTGNSSHVGYISRSTANVTSNYYYGTDYKYENGRFSLAGDITIARYNGSNIDEIKSKYTCLATSADATCSILNLVDEVFNAASVYLLRLSSSTARASIGTFGYNGRTVSISSVGYMKDNDDSLFGNTTFSTSAGSSATQVTKSASLSANYWFANDAVFNTDEGVYELSDPFQVSSSEYASLVGKYTFRDSSHDFNNNIVYYIAGVSGSTMYYLELTNGQTLEDVNTNHALGDDIIDNGDGTYTLSNPFYIKKTEWATRYSEAADTFTCGGSAIMCSDPVYIVSAAGNNYTGYAISRKIVLGQSHNDLELTNTVVIPFYQYKRNSQYYMDNGYVFSCGIVDANKVTTTCKPTELKLITNPSGNSLYAFVNNYYFATSVEWDGSKYNLVDTIGLENYNNIDNLSTHHYYCPSAGQTSCATVRYIHYHSTTNAFYTTLSDGMTTPGEALARSRSNQTDSTMKNAIDRWYEHNLIDYTDKLEDAVFCNDRSIYEIGGWVADGRVDEKINFGAYGRNMVSGANPDLGCTNPEDAFTVSSENGNGKLTYPTALITADEAIMMGHGSFSSSLWTMSPYNFYQYYANAIAAMSSDPILASISFSQSNSYQARPVIVLKNGAFITGGEGTAANPWTVGWD